MAAPMPSMIRRVVPSFSVIRSRTLAVRATGSACFDPLDECSQFIQ